MKLTLGSRIKLLDFLDIPVGTCYRTVLFQGSLCKCREKLISVDLSDDTREVFIIKLCRAHRFNKVNQKYDLSMLGETKVLVWS